MIKCCIWKCNKCKCDCAFAMVDIGGSLCPFCKQELWKRRKWPFQCMFTQKPFALKHCNKPVFIWWLATQSPDAVSLIPEWGQDPAMLAISKLCPRWWRRGLKFVELNTEELPKGKIDHFSTKCAKWENFLIATEVFLLEQLFRNPCQILLTFLFLRTTETLYLPFSLSVSFQMTRNFSTVVVQMKFVCSLFHAV